jgi:hypothetical protein
MLTKLPCKTSQIAKLSQFVAPAKDLTAAEADHAKTIDNTFQSAECIRPLGRHFNVRYPTDTRKIGFADGGVFLEFRLPPQSSHLLKGIVLKTKELRSELQNLALAQGHVQQRFEEALKAHDPIDAAKARNDMDTIATTVTALAKPKERRKLPRCYRMNGQTGIEPDRR